MDFPVIFIPIILLIVGIIILSAYFSAKRRKELMLWAQAKGWSFSPEKDHTFDSRFSAFKLLRQGENRYAHNIIRGIWNERSLIAFDYHYETHSTNSKGHRQTHHHHFSAVIMESNLPLKPLFIRPEGFFDKITEFFGADDIDFESAEFSRTFFVKADDRRWAYDVLHARTMEFLLQSPRFTIQFDHTHVFAARSGTFKITDFQDALGVIKGILDRFPPYLVKQLKGES
ncbi:hypothetical protein JW926_16560 [Candidatus Sumerlaeota bacterium]|nr:hypothetical protein [Candidatus Sumerlaeota bacterium]